MQLLERNGEFVTSACTNSCINFVLARMRKRRKLPVYELWRPFTKIYVVVQVYPWFEFYFPLFLGVVMYDEFNKRK